MEEKIGQQFFIRHSQAEASAADDDLRPGADVDPEGAAGCEFGKIMRCQLQEVVRCLADFLASPADPEATHQLRVKIRALRSLISFIKPLFDQSEYHRIQERLKEAAQMFAHLREIDVLRAEWSALLTAHPRLSGGNEALMGVLQSERAVEQAVVYEQVVAGFVATRLFDVLLWLEGLPAEADKEPSFADYAKKGFASRRKKAKKCFANTDLQDLKAIHALRIRYKKLRYVSAILESYLKTRDKEGRDSYKAMQDRLGRVVDGQRNLELLRGLMSKDDQPGLANACGILTGYLMASADQALNELEES